MVLVNTSYVCLVENLTNAISLRGQEKSLILKFRQEVGVPVRIQNDNDVFFYLQLRMKEFSSNVLSKIPICIDILDESVDEAFPVMDGFHQPDTFGINDDVPPNNPTRNVHE